MTEYSNWTEFDEEPLYNELKRRFWIYEDDIVDAIYKYIKDGVSGWYVDARYSENPLRVASAISAVPMARWGEMEKISGWDLKKN